MAGLVAVTPAAGNVGPIGGASIIGLVQVVCLPVGCAWPQAMLGATTRVDVFGVHGVGGIVVPPDRRVRSPPWAATWLTG